jgi:hypothetical protein
MMPFRHLENAVLSQYRCRSPNLTQLHAVTGPWMRMGRVLRGVV